MKGDYYFASSVNLDMHPMRDAQKEIKEQYFSTLVYFLEQVHTTKIKRHIRKQLELYREFFELENWNGEKESYIKSIVICRFLPWRRRIIFWLICDIALIVIDFRRVKKIVLHIKSFVSNRRQKLIDDFLLLLSGKLDKFDKRYLLQAKEMIEQYRLNNKFFSESERSIIVTANMSAGKSTLVNAVIGLALAKTSQEVCTGKVSYFYNKPFDDGRICVNNGELDYVADCKSIKEMTKERSISVAVYFLSGIDSEQRICIIDTPGVNSAINREHGEIAQKFIRENRFDSLLCVLNANKFGTDEEIDYLKWISNNVSKGKVVFVLNKLDDFRIADDNIQKSIDGVIGDLKDLGYKNPVVCPVSAYFAYLLKKKSSGISLSEDEEDEYSLYIKKFSKKDYNFAIYYGDTHDIATDYEGMLKRSGFYYLEKIIYGGVI